MAFQSSHKIKKRSNANDVFITPLEIAKQQISFHNIKENDLWLDPCRNSKSGSYYQNFPENVRKDWCEILENKDFFDFNLHQIPPFWKYFRNFFAISYIFCSKILF